MSGLERFVAWRHLRDHERRTRGPLWVGLSIVALGALLLLAAFFLDRRPSSPSPFMVSRPSLLVANLRLGAIYAFGVGGLISVLGAFCASFTLFTGISIFGVFLGTSAPIVALSVMSGFENDLKTKIRGTKADVVVTGAGGRSVAAVDDLLRRVRAVPQVRAATPYIEAEVMVRSAANPAGVLLRGIDPETAGGVIDLVRTLQEGKLDYLAAPARIPRPGAGDLAPGAGQGADAPGAEALPAVIVGRELYDKTLRVLVGSEVDLACPACDTGPTGPMPRLRRFRVAGAFYSGMYEFDQKLVYISLAEAQRFLGMAGEVTGIEVRAADPEGAAALAATVQTALGPAYEVRSWEELNTGLYRALRVEKIAMFVGLAFILLVASFSIVGNLVMIVTEKAQEVAILKAMGASDAAILRIFVAEGLIIGVVGMGLGLPLGIGACLALGHFGLPIPEEVYYIRNLPVVMRSQEIAGLGLLAMLLCLLATLYPAWKASRMGPVDGLRYE